MLWIGGFVVNLFILFLLMLFYCNFLEVCCFFIYVFVYCYYYFKWLWCNVWVDLKKVLLFVFKLYYYYDIYYCGLRNFLLLLCYEYVFYDKIGLYIEWVIVIKNSWFEI